MYVTACAEGITAQYNDMVRRSEGVDDLLRQRFAISPLLDLEIDVGGEGWVGLSANASHRLRQNVTASVIAEKLGYSSVDYVRKRYLDEIVEHDSADVALRQMREQHLRAYDKFYHTFQPPRTDAPIGVFAFDLAMVRARCSLELLTITARQGFLLETCVVARCLVEQFAYAVYVWDKTEDVDVFEAKPQSLIKGLVPVCSSAGRAYGILSRLSHYDPKLHYLFIGNREGGTVNQRGWRFKIIATAWTFYLFHLNFLVFKSAYSGCPSFDLLAPLNNSAREAFDRHFWGVKNFWVDEVRHLMDER